ncbi:MAG TPA: hypothetical protein VFB74_22995 [Kribbellaceae bacterium]|nr:hypothetical protein [Kribbellaceae bacterium]
MPDLTRDLGPGTVTISGEGAVAAVAHPTRAHSMLLEEDPAAPEAAMHDPSRRWGKGFVVTDRAARRFDQPASLSWSDDGVDLVHDLGDLELSIGRRVADAWTESYQLRNVASYRVTIGSVAVSTPWRDVYGSSRESLRRAVHAHLWTGGADAWVWAVPMDGSGPGLGLTLTEGELWAYSVESRDTETGSNVRGHLYLHVTDHARASHAMGGQPQIRLDPGATYRWSWRLDWYDSLAAFHATRQPLLDADVLTAQVGESITLRLAPGATTSTPQPVVGSTAGIQHVVASDGRRRSRISLLFHPPLRELVEQRALGGDHYLAFGLGPLLGTLATRLTTAGRDDDATRMREHLQRHAGTFLAYGDDLPPHEVNYEQSMVAPLLELLVAAYGAAPGTVDGAVDGGELRRRLPWLTAFAADQPDARLRHIPIRHWDGYWFGPAAAVGRRVPALLVGAQCRRAAQLARRARRPCHARAAARGRVGDPACQPGELPAGRLRHLRVRVPELRQRRAGAHRRPAGQRPGLGPGLRAAPWPGAHPLGSGPCNRCGSGWSATARWASGSPERWTHTPTGSPVDTAPRSP